MSSRFDRFVLLVVACVSLYWVSRFYDRGISIVDEGFIASLAMRILNGDVPYRDFFTLITPGVLLLHAGLYELFGPSLLVGRYVLLVIATGIPILIYLVARHRLNPAASLAAACLSLIWGPAALENINHANYNWVSHFFGLLALWQSSIAVSTSTSIAEPAVEKNRSIWRFLFIGISLGLAIFSKQTIGGYAFIAISLFFCWHEKGAWRFKALAAVCSGAFLVNLPLLLWLVWNDSLLAMWRHILLIPMSDFSREAALPYPSLWPLWPNFPRVDLQVSIVFLALIPFAHLVVTGLWVAQRIRDFGGEKSPSSDTRRLSAQEALIILYSGFAFLGNFPRPDYGHLIFNMSAGFITLMILASRIHANIQHHWGRFPAWVAMLVLATLLFRPLFEQGIRNTLWTVGTRDSVLDTPRAGIKVSATAANIVNDVLAQLQRIKASGEEVFITPHAPLLFFLADVRNPTRYEVLMAGNYERGTMQEVIELLKKKRVGWVVLRHWPADNLMMSDYAPEFTAFINQTYESTLRVETYEFFRLRSTKP